MWRGIGTTVMEGYAGGALVRLLRMKASFDGMTIYVWDGIWVQSWRAFVWVMPLNKESLN